MIKEKVKALWKLCFTDSEAFTELYFRLRYSNEVNLAISSGNEIIAALQMLPYPMTFCDRIVPTSYISGACTHPDFRSRGVMRELLAQAFCRMKEKEIFFSTLIPAEPWLFGYYARMGYAPVFRYAEKLITVPEFLPSRDITVDSTQEYQEDVYQYFNRKLNERPCCIQHTAEDFKVILADLAISNGQLFCAWQAKEIKGIALIYKGENQILVAELVTESKDAENSLLHAIKEQTGCNRMKLFLPPTPGMQSQPLGMARIIDAKTVLQLYTKAFPQEEILLEVQDEQLNTNSGYYSLRNGVCSFSNTPQAKDAYQTMNIAQLTERMLQPLHPYMSLMLN